MTVKNETVKTKVGALRKWYDRLGWELRYNDFSKRIEVWKGGLILHADYNEIQPEDRSLARGELFYQPADKIKPINLSTADWRDYVRKVALDKRYNPVRDYLANLKPVSKEPSESVFELFFDLDYERFEDAGISKADAIAYVREVSHLLFVNLYRRATQPGCKYDQVTTLYSEFGGIGKSDFVRNLSPYPELVWEGCSGAILSGDETELGRKTAGKWVVQVNEVNLTATNKEGYKSNIALQSFHYDKKFEDHTTRQRQDVMLPTTNVDRFLCKDESGYRRFLIVPVRRKQQMSSDDAKQLMDKVRDNYFAAAIARYKKDGVYTPMGDLEMVQERLAASFAYDTTIEIEVIINQIQGWIRRQENTEEFSIAEVCEELRLDPRLLERHMPSVVKALNLKKKRSKNRRLYVMPSSDVVH